MSDSLDFDLDGLDDDTGSLPVSTPSLDENFADPFGGIEYTGDRERDSLAEMEALLKAFAADTAYPHTQYSRIWTCVVFQSRSQKAAYLTATGWDRCGDKYLIAEDLRRTLPDTTTSLDVPEKKQESIRREDGALIRKAKEEAARFALVTDSEYWFCICFDTQEERQAFHLEMGWGDDVYQDGQDVGRKQGIALPTVRVPFTKAKPDRKWDALSLEF